MKLRWEAKLSLRKPLLMDYPTEKQPRQNTGNKRSKKSEERIMSRDEGRKLGAKNQEGEKLSSAKNDGSANEAEKGGKVVSKDATFDGLTNGKTTKAKTEKWPTGKK